LGHRVTEKNKPDDGYILGETCNFSIINKLVCSDRIFRNYVYSFYVDEEWSLLCDHCPQEEHSPEGKRSKNHRLNNLAWNVAYYAKNFHEASNFLNDTAFFKTMKRKFVPNSKVCLYYKFQSVNAEQRSDRCSFSESNETDK